MVRKYSRKCTYDISARISFFWRRFTISLGRSAQYRLRSFERIVGPAHESVYSCFRLTQRVYGVYRAIAQLSAQSRDAAIVDPGRFCTSPKNGQHASPSLPYREIPAFPFVQYLSPILNSKKVDVLIFTMYLPSNG